MTTYLSYDNEYLLDDYLELDALGHHRTQSTRSVQSDVPKTASRGFWLRTRIYRYCSWSTLTLFLLFSVGAALFVYDFVRLYHGANRIQVDQLYGRVSFVMAKSAARMINYHASLTLLTTLPRLCSRMIERGYGRHYRTRWRLTQGTIDWLNDWYIHRHGFHLYFYYQILFWSLVHAVGHVVNLVHFQSSPFNRDTSVSLVVRFFTHPTLFTGLLLLLCLFWILLWAWIRRRGSTRHEVFYACHLIGILLLFSLLFFHGSFCYLSIPIAGETSRYACSPWTSWMWLLPSLVLYVALERGWRAYESHVCYKVVCKNVIEHPSYILEIILHVHGLANIGMGQHILLNFRPISRLQWHPFTVTKSSTLHPNELVLSVHIRVVGDWTSQLWHYFQSHQYEESDKESGFRIDGPFSSSLSSMPKYSTLFLIGGGIGQTPFTSILWNLMLSTLNPYSDEKEVESNHIHYLGIFRGLKSIEWFQRLLIKLEAIEPLKRKLSIRTFITGTLSDVERNTLLLDAADGGNPFESSYDPKAVLDKVSFGRPNLGHLFAQVRQQVLSSSNSTPMTPLGSQRVGVYYCGPTALGQQVQDMCEAQDFIHHEARREGGGGGGDERNDRDRTRNETRTETRSEAVLFEFHQESFH